jgi:hypothetical protein
MSSLIFIYEVVGLKDIYKLIFNQTNWFEFLCIQKKVVLSWLEKAETALNRKKLSHFLVFAQEY